MASRTRSLLLAGLLVLYAGILVWNCQRVGITVDEPTRLLGGHLLWMGLPDHPPKDQPPLLSLVVGWAPRYLNVPLHRDNPIWKRAWKDHVYSFILDQMPGPEIGRLFFLARLGVIVFSLLAAWVIWVWSRRVFSETTALVLVALFVLLPSVRAHSALITSDMAAAFTLLLAGYCAWNYWRSPNARNSIFLGLAAGLACTAKFSLLIVPPLAVLAVGARFLTFRQRPPGRKAVDLFTVPVLALLVLLAAYRFDTRRVPAAEAEAMRAQKEFPPLFLAALPVLQVIPTPRDMMEGVRSLGRNNAEGNPVYLNGKVYPHGHWAYFPVCLALKPPIGFLILAIAGIGFLTAGLATRRIPPDRLFLLLPGLIYFAFATQASGQFGIRLILPTIAFLVLTTGFAVELLRKSRAGRWALVAVFGGILVSTARTFPQDLSYFNEFAGGPENGWRYLSDSNIDWGHNLPELKSYIESRRLSGVNYYQFGYDKSSRYFAPGILNIAPLPWTPQHVSSLVLRPGPGVHAVHVTLLTGQNFPEPYRQYLQYFRDRQPDGRAGYGIFIYRVP